MRVKLDMITKAKFNCILVQTQYHINTCLLCWTFNKMTLF